ncbi:MAG TPA: sugar transferase [Solirubrobacteraceae bacterium]|jgi:lipopolysaccharide/colanic/teichoic acid biosynthesis glycosyltransferase
MAIALRIRPSGQTELEHPEPVLVPVAIDPVRVVADVNAELAKLAGDPAQAAAEVFVTTPAVPAAEVVAPAPAVPVAEVAVRHDWRFAIKYALDRVLALAAVVVLAPLMLTIALAVRLSSPGPVFFRQWRVGLNGQLFALYKFRTMLDEPEDDGFQPPEGAAPGGIEGADRRTPLGRLLRASSADELPQLINVVRGDMSLIGPRPERPEFAERFAAEVPGYARRHRVKGGITGWAQANGLRGQTSIADRAVLDNHYIDNWSLRLELATVLLTVVEVLRFRDHARGEKKVVSGHQQRRLTEPERAGA